MRAAVAPEPEPEPVTATVPPQASVPAPVPPSASDSTSAPKSAPERARPEAGADHIEFAPPEALEADGPPPADWGDEAPPWEDEPSDSYPAASVLKAHPPAPAVPVREWPAKAQNTEQPLSGASAVTATSVERQHTPQTVPEPDSEIVAYSVLERPMRDEAQAAAPAPPPAVRSTPEGDFWHTLVQEMVAREAITALVRELALQSQLVAKAEGQWTLRVEKESLAHKGACDRLQTALSEAGHPVKLVVEIGAVADSPSRRNAIVANSRQNAAQEMLLSDPFVQEMMRDFGAKIVAGSVKPL